MLEGVFALVESAFYLGKKNGINVDWKRSWMISEYISMK